MSRSLLWTTVDCQQRFLAGGLLQQYLWGQLIHPRPPYGSNSPLSPSLLSLRPVRLDTEWMVTGAVSAWRATNRRSPETISSWGLCVWCVSESDCLSLLALPSGNPDGCRNCEHSCRDTGNVCVCACPCSDVCLCVHEKPCA